MIGRVRGLALFALMTALPPLAAQSVDAVRAQALAGCWAVQVGTFKGSTVDSGMTVLPTVVKLDTLPGADIWGKPFGRLLLGLPDTTGRYYRRGFFELKGANRIRLIWASGFTSMSIDATTTAERMRGTAQAWTDYGGEQVAPITLTRTTCP